MLSIITEMSCWKLWQFLWSSYALIFFTLESGISTLSGKNPRPRAVSFFPLHEPRVTPKSWPHTLGPSDHMWIWNVPLWFSSQLCQEDWSSYLEIVAFAFWLIALFQTQEFLQRGMSSLTCPIISFSWLLSLHIVLCSFDFCLYARGKEKLYGAKNKES